MEAVRRETDGMDPSTSSPWTQLGNQQTWVMGAQETLPIYP